MIRAKIVLVLIMLGFLVNVSGCGPSLGPAFSRIETVPEKEGLVYIYRPAKFFGGGVYYDIRANGNVINTFYQGGYYPYYANPGEIEFSAKTEASSSVTIDVKPGQVYYLRGTVGIGFFVGHPHLDVVSPEIGEKEIQDCKLLPEVNKKE